MSNERLDRAFRLHICTSCRNHEHERCGPIWDPSRHRVLYCECLGPLNGGRSCTEPYERP